MEKHIDVTSNDPLTPQVSLSIQVDYTPLYELLPATLTPSLAFGVEHTEEIATLNRTDGKPFQVVKFDASKPWITAKVMPAEKGGGTNNSVARIQVEIQREGPPRHFNETIQLYSADQTNTPVSTIYLYGQVMGAISVAPESLYWNVSEKASTTPTDRPEAMVMRLVTISSASGQTFEPKNPRSTIAGLHVELVSKEPGKVYELIAKLTETPAQTVAGNVSFDTSTGSQATIEVPVIVNVSKP
jgi:hypothetical protein